MANPEHLAILKQGVAQWNRWRETHPETEPDLNWANLSGLNLNGANFNGAQFRGADLRGVNLTTAHLRRADLHEADLRIASLICADLREANLSGANLNGANLSEAELGFADLSGAYLGATNFGKVDLSAAKGLERVGHVGPSTIGIDTIYKSRGKIPEIFLLGCGVPDEFIAYIGSMVGRPIEFYSCFISYSTKDHEFAERLHADLQAKGVRCWFAPHDMHYGKKMHEQIDEAIRLHDKLLLILSEHSMSSEWVGEEIARARKREAQEKRQMLFPVGLAPFDPVIKEWECFDADRGKDSAREIREYPIPDFSRWDTDNRAYQTEFGKLVRDLKAVGSG